MYLVLLKAEGKWEAILCFDDLSCSVNDIFQSASIITEVFVSEKDHIMQELRTNLHVDISD